MGIKGQPEGAARGFKIEEIIYIKRRKIIIRIDKII